MIKKIAAALLVCIMLFSLTACSVSSNQPSNTQNQNNSNQSANNQTNNTNNQTSNANSQTNTPAPIQTKTEAFDAYRKSVNNISYDNTDAISMDMDMNIIINATYGSESYEMSILSNIKIITDGVTGKLSMSMESDEFGNILILFDGEKAYAEFNGVGELLDEDDFDEIMGQMDMFMVEMPDFDESAIKSFATEQSNSGQVITLVLDGKTLSDFVLDNTENLMGEDLSEYNFELSDIELVVETDADGNPKYMTMAMEMDFEIEGEQASMTMKYEYFVNAMGSAVKIDLSKIETAEY